MPPETITTQDTPSPHQPPTASGSHSPKSSFGSSFSKLSFPKKFSRKHLAIFAVLFAGLGSYFIFQSFAATPPIVTKEAETLTMPASGASIISDSNASGGQAVKFTQKVSATGSVDLPNQVTSLTVRAKQTACRGDASFTLTIDNAPVATKTVTSGSWSDYTTTGLNLPAGSHSLSLSYDNPYSWKKCTRALFIDKIDFFGPDIATTPAPTVTLSANPTTVTSGSTSTLTWSSTNANSCTASGSWSGTKPTSGNETTAPITANSTYSLSCTGAGGTGSGSVGVGVSTTTSNCPSYTNGYGDFKAGNWPSACWRPFADNSPFNMLLPANPKLDPNSTSIVSRLFDLSSVDLPAKINVDLDGGGGEPTYYSQSTDPEFTIHCTLYACSTMEGTKVRIPAGAKIENPTDQHLTVIDQATGYEYDFWVVETTTIPSVGGVLNVSSGGRSLISGSGLLTGSSATASYFASLAGRVRLEELAAGKIKHAIFIAINCSNGTTVYPASNGHGGQACSSIGQSNTNAPAMGQHFKLNYTEADIDALSAPAWRKTMYKAMVNYGMFFGDTGTGNLFTIERESDYMYNSLGYPAKWQDFAKANNWTYFAGGGEYGPAYIGDFGQFQPDGVDWKRLQVIDPCVSQKTCL